MDEERKIRGYSTFEQIAKEHPVLGAAGKRSLMNRSTRGQFPSYIKLGFRHEPLWRDLEVKLWLRKNLPAVVECEMFAAASERYADDWTNHQL